MRGRDGPISQVHVAQLSRQQRDALVEFARSTQPANIGHDLCRMLNEKGLIRPTGRMHRSYYLTALGRAFALAILVHTH